MRCPDTRRRRVPTMGFTLIEVMLVLALVGLVLTTAQMLFSQILVTNATMAAEARVADSRAAGARSLRGLLRNAQAAADSANRFSGDGHSAAFSTRCPSDGGWLVPCRVTIALVVQGDSSLLVAELPRSEPTRLFAMRGAGELRYLDRAARETSWLVTWGTSIVMPAAVALIVGPDTVLFPTGDGNG